MLLVAEDRDDHHLALGRDMRGMADQFDPAAAGQVEVDQQHVGTRLVEHLPPLLEIGGHAHQTDVRRFFQGMGERFAEAKLIFDDQDAEQ